MEKFYGMSNDYMFKAVMQECEDVLRNLVCALMNLQEEDVVNCEVTNPIILGESIGDKECILDIKLILNGNKNLNIELQMRKEDYWAERSLLYWARTYDDIKSGEDYELLKPTYHIGIIDFPLYDGDDELLSEYKIMNVRNHRIYTDKFGIKVLNLRQVNNPKNTDERVVKWARIFKAKTLNELEEIAGDEEVFANMVLELRKLSEDEKIKQQMEARADYESRIATARGAGYREGKEEGIQKGLQEGIQEGKVKELVELVKDGLLPEDIAASRLNISVEELKSLL